MPIVLTTPISVPNVQRIDLERPPAFFVDACQLVLQIRSGPAQGRIRTVELWVRNGGAAGRCDVLRVNPTPVGFDDDITVTGNFLEVVNAADQIDTAYAGANRAAKIRAVLTALQALNIIQLAGAVS